MQKTRTVNTALFACVSNKLCMSKGNARDFKYSVTHLEVIKPHERSVDNVSVFDTTLVRDIQFFYYRRQSFRQTNIYNLHWLSPRVSTNYAFLSGEETWHHEGGMWTASTRLKNDCSTRARQTHLSGSSSLCPPHSAAAKLCYFGKHFRETGVAERRSRWSSLQTRHYVMGTRSNHESRLRDRQLLVNYGVSESTWPRSSSPGG